MATTQRVLFYMTSHSLGSPERGVGCGNQPQSGTHSHTRCHSVVWVQVVGQQSKWRLSIIPEFFFGTLPPHPASRASLDSSAFVILADPCDTASLKARLRRPHRVPSRVNNGGFGWLIICGRVSHRCGQLYSLFLSYYDQPVIET
jgi:hypothetical protein